MGDPGIPRLDDTRLALTVLDAGQQARGESPLLQARVSGGGAAFVSKPLLVSCRNRRFSPLIQAEGEGARL